MEVSTMTITSPPHSVVHKLFARPLRVTSHPEAVPERPLKIPRRIDHPATAAGVANELLWRRREDVILAQYLDAGIPSLAVSFSQSAGSERLACQPARSSPWSRPA